MEIPLQPGETKIDTWTLFYIPEHGGKYNGKLTITNRRVLYEPLLDASLKGVLTGTRVRKLGEFPYFEIDKSEIRNLDIVKKFFSKSCTLTLSDGSRHTFDYGAMNIDKVVSAIQAN